LFYPTHRHADGGLYQHMGEMKGRATHDGVTGNDPGWVDGQAYRNEDDMRFWTDNERWIDRFTELDSNETQVLVFQEQDQIAAFKFRTQDAGDVRYMLITAGPQPAARTTNDERDWLKRVLGGMAEAVSMGLHIRDHDFPDLMGDVNAFHAKFGQEYLGKPRMLPEDLFDFRTKFHAEETTEYRDEQEKLKGAIIRQDRRDIINALELQLDALVDSVWVVLGTADLQFGRRAFIEAWRRVVKANMAKVLASDDPDAEDSGREVKYDIRKPKGWEAPDHRDLVADNAVFDDIFAEAPEPEETNETVQDAGRYSDTRAV